MPCKEPARRRDAEPPNKRIATISEEAARAIKLVLDAVPHGLVLWDADLRFLVCNSRHLQIYDIPASRAVPGVAMSSFLEGSSLLDRKAAGSTMIEEADRARLAAGEWKSERLLTDGRIISVSYTALSGLGWAAFHEDVSAHRADLAALAESEQALRQQNDRFTWAINHMAQALCMFDRDRRLVVSNRQYAELYRIPPDQVRPGQTLEEVLKQRAAYGNIPVGGVANYVASRLAAHATTEQRADTVELEDGRTILLLHQTLPDGGWVATHQDISEQRELEARMRFLAQHDPLTGLANRAYFREQMDAAEHRIRKGERFAVHFIDLDGFKPVNDTFGHAVGDLLLSAVSTRIKECAGDSGFVSRLGGDEFAILQGPLRSFRDSTELARRLVEMLAEPFDLEGHHVSIGASVGIAMAPADGSDSLNLMRHADLALYDAKRAGRGTFHYFRATPHQRVLVPALAR